MHHFPMKTVMVTTTDVEPFGLSEAEFTAANEKLANLRKAYSFTELTDEQR